MTDEAMYKQHALDDLNENKQERYSFERWLLDDEIEIHKLQASLTGKIYNPNTQKFEQPDNVKGLMNDDGARFVCWTYLYPIIKNGKLTYLDKEDKKQLMFINSKAMNQHLHYNNVLYDLDSHNIGTVQTIVMTFLDTVLSRSLGGKERERLQTTQRFVSKENISSTPEAPQQFTADMGQYFGQKKKRWGMF